MITPDEAIEVCVKEGAQGISLGLAKSLQAERDRIREINAELLAALKAATIYAERGEAPDKWMDKFHLAIAKAELGS